MNTEQLKGILSRYNCLWNIFVDITKDVPSAYPQLYIVNTDPLPNPGKHWVCVILYNYDKVDYFDSLGRPAAYYGCDLQDFLQRNGQKTMLYKGVYNRSSRMYADFMSCISH